MDFQIQNLLPVVTLHGLRVRFRPPSLQRSCSRWSWDPAPQNNQSWCLMTSFLSAHGLSSFQSLMLKGKDNITSFFSPNVKTFAGDPHWPRPLFAYHDSWSIMWDWAFRIPRLTKQTYLHVDCTWLYLNTSLTPPLVPRSLEKGGAAESFPGTPVNMSTCKSAMIICIYYNEAHDHNYSHLPPNSCFLL